MYFDTNISLRYPDFESNKLDELDYDGICINRLLSIDELDRYTRPITVLSKNKRIYERIELKIGKKRMDIDVSRALKADLFVVNISDSSCLSSAIEMRPDMITFDYTKTFYHFDEEDIMEAIRRNVFFEIVIVGGLYGGENKVMWMGNVRRLLKVTRGRNVVVSSGATCSTELKDAQDALKILNGIEGVEKDVLINSSRLIRSCELRRNPVIK